MQIKRFLQFFCLFLIVAAVAFSGGCRSNTGGTPEGLIVINAPVSGKVRRVIAIEGTNVEKNAPLLEIALESKTAVPPDKRNRQTPAGTATSQAEIKAAEEQLQRASVELQRIEPLVASGSAPQPHLDAARAEYQKAQERVDRLRRQPPNMPPDLSAGQLNSEKTDNEAKENIIAVPAPSAGNVRVISVRAGQTVKKGEAIATIFTKR